MVKIHFLQKVLKKWSSFRGGYRPKVEFYTFLNPSLTYSRHFAIDDCQNVMFECEITFIYLWTCFDSWTQWKCKLIVSFIIHSSSFLFLCSFYLDCCWWWLWCCEIKTVINISTILRSRHTIWTQFQIIAILQHEANSNRSQAWIPGESVTFRIPSAHILCHYHHHYLLWVNVPTNIVRIVQ